MEIIVKEIGIKALGEHLTGEQQHRDQTHGNKGAVLEQQTHDFHRRSLFKVLRLGLHALFVEREGDDKHDERAHRHDRDAADHGRVLHVGDGFPVLAEHNVSVRIKAFGIGKRGDQQHGDRAERGTDRTPDRQPAAFVSVCRNDRGQRSEGDLQHGICHAEKDIGHRGIDAGGGHMSLFADPGQFEEHQHGRESKRQRRIKDPGPVAPVAGRLDRVADTAHDRVVDAVPDARRYEHQHNEQRAEMKDIGVEFLQQRGHKTEDQTACRIDHRITGVIFDLQTACAGNIAFVHGIPFLYVILLYREKTQQSYCTSRRPHLARLYWQ